MINCNKLNNILDKYHKKINTNEVEFIVFYKHIDYCSFSKNALDLLIEKNKSFKAYCVKDPNTNINKMNSLIKCLKKHSKKTNFNHEHNTLPIIFYKGKFIGGYTELVKFINQ